MKPRPNFGVVENYLKHPNPETSREGLYRVKAILESWEGYVGKVVTVGGWVKTMRK